jgi:hypothetical protein
VDRSRVAEEVLSLLPEWARARAVIAGSFAVPFGKPEDVDVWILDTPPELFTTATRQIRTKLIDEAYLNVEAPLDADESYQSTEVDPSHKFHVAAKIEIGMYGPGEIWNAHIILSNAKSLHLLLDEFDLSIHQAGFYIEEPLVVFYGSSYTPVSEQPRVLKLTRPKATRDRILKIFPRYGHVITKEDAVRLNAALAPVSELEVRVTIRPFDDEPLFLDEEFAA